MYIYLLVVLLVISVILNVSYAASRQRNRRVPLLESRGNSSTIEEENLALEETMKLQAATLQAAANAIAITDRNCKVQWVNPAFTQLTGYAIEEAKGESMGLVHPDKHSDAFYKHLLQTIESGLVWDGEIINVRKDGHEYVEQQTITPIRNENNEISHYITIKQDCTTRRQMEEKLRQQNNYLATLHQITLDLLNQRNVNDLFQSIVDRAAEFLDAPFCEMTFLEGDELVVRAFTYNQSFLAGERINREMAPLSWQAVDSRLPVIIDDYSHWPLRREIYDPLNLSAVIVLPILIADQCVGVLDVSRSKPSHTYADSEIQAATMFAQLAALAFDNARLHEDLRQESIRDPLTGLFNRRFMEEALAKEISRAKRQSSPLTVVMLDLDHLKEINDTCGHHAGDDALVKVSSLIQRLIRAGDTACRYGGDEFVIILSDTTVDDAMQRMESLLAHIKRISVLADGRISVTVSIGIAGYPHHSTTGIELLGRADKALYRAKKAGRDRVMVFQGKNFPIGQTREWAIIV